MNCSYKNIFKIIIALLLLLHMVTTIGFSQQVKSKMEFTVAMDNPASHTYQVSFQCDGIQKDWLDFKIPVWMPGYYQLLDYADHIASFRIG